MDPDHALFAIRLALAEARAVAGSDPAALLEHLADQVEEWLSRGGFAPAAWRPVGTG